MVAKELLNHPQNNTLIEQLGGFDENTFFRQQQSNPKSIFYIDESKYFPSIKEITDSVHQANGIVFLAHPYIYSFTMIDETIEEIIRTANIDGIECIYPLFSEEQRSKLIAMAQKYNKFISGGTDYHALKKPNIELGSGINNNVAISFDLVKNWVPRNITH